LITDTRSIPQSAVKQTFFWLTQFSRDWRGEVPLRLHEGHGGLGAAPAFTNQFVEYIGSIKCSSEHCHACRCINPSCQRCAARRREEREEGRARSAHRTRTTKAFRKLRERAPREFDVVNLICRHGLDLPQVAAALNDRFARNGRAERIDVGGVLVLAMSGTDKLRNWY
jgi:hypothetical protein